MHVYIIRALTKRFGMLLLKRKASALHICLKMVKSATQVWYIKTALTLSYNFFLQFLQRITRKLCKAILISGDVIVNARYRLTNDNGLELTFLASTTKPTPINLANHCYFNLGKCFFQFYILS